MSSGGDDRPTTAVTLEYGKMAAILSFVTQEDGGCGS